MARDRFMAQSLGAFQRQIKGLRILLVGAGGIGCELLKNLVLSGFGEIHIVDLDTIDLSNLNRQFLFRHEHIKKSKAIVAKEAAQKFNPSVKLQAHHANIKDSQFNLSWFQSFNIVFNALDNLDARRHVNRMCLLADVPLIESGTTGFDGQVQVIKKGRSECYDCTPKPIPKSFPVCTIRSTPKLFGESEVSDDMDASEDAENAEEIKHLKEEALALKKIRESMVSEEFPKLIFDKVYKQDIERLRSMEDMWKTRKRPNPLDYQTICAEANSIDASISNSDQIEWSLAQNLTVFSDSVKRLSERYTLLRAANGESGLGPTIEFDKDDEDTLDFVAAAANLRSLVFEMQPKSKFNIKQMAGNIIPAIATTNAMTAGLCVLQAFKVLKGEYHKVKMAFLERSTARVINSEPLRHPNPDCSICGVASTSIHVDPSRATLHDLVEDVLKPELGYSSELSIRNDTGLLYDPDFDDNLSKKFSELGIRNDSMLVIVDEDDSDPHVNLSLAVTEQTLPQDSKPVILETKIEVARRPKGISNNDNGNRTNGHDDRMASSAKRKRSASPPPQPVEKKGRVEGKTAKGDAVVQVDDSHEGAIMIDD
ncbi:MAG: hypothetical protein LQ340_000222 [Diploschistes diacapsis]|nr:MAG: hypothetical protein LQ340_000222 [Diploschistes diacapsis]